MAKRPVKLVFRSHPAIMAIILVLVILATIAVVSVQSTLDECQNRFEMLRLQAAALESENETLASDIDNLGSIESAIKIAEEELGLVCPDTVIFNPAID